MRAALFVVAFIFYAGAAAAQAPQEPTYYTAKVIHAFPHDPTSFTQGLFFDDGALYETSGQYGQSRLRRVALDTGATLREEDLPDAVFGEGSTAWDGRIVVLTWKAGKGFVFDRKDFAPKTSFTYVGEGWGLTHDGKRLIMSDGGSTLRFLDPKTFKETGRLEVTFRGEPLTQLNELEWVKGEIYANVWRTDAIVRINPETGVVDGVVDLRGLLPDEAYRQGRPDVLNGVAYNPQTDKLYVTGKYWPTLFEIELIPQTADAP